MQTREQQAGPDAGATVHRLLSGSLHVFVPHEGEATRRWFRDLTGSPALKLRWDMQAPGHWVIGRSHLSAITFGIAERYGAVDLLMDYRRTETCGVKCQHAGALDCTCSCLGRQHGGPSRLNHLAISSESSLPGRLIRVSRVVTADMAAAAR